MVFVSRKAKGRKPTARRAAKSLTKLQKMEVKKLVAQPLETKYVAEPTKVFVSSGVIGDVTGYTVLANIVSGGPNITAWNLIPNCPQATVSGLAGQVVSGGNQRQGNKVTDVTFKTDFQFYINNLSGFPSIDATVKLFICRARQIKSNYNLTSLSPGTLLDAGNGTSIDWSVAAANDALLNAMLPINKEAFTVLKAKTFRIVKNQEANSSGTGTTGAPNLDTPSIRTFSYTHKHKSALHYLDDNVAGNFDLPTNFNYFAFCVVYESQIGNLPPNSVLCNARNHMWYKDA